MQIGTTATAAANFAERRRVLVEQIEELERQQGEAQLDGIAFDRKGLDRARAELEAITAAEGAAARREQQRATAETARTRADQMVQLRIAEDRRLDAIEQAELCAHGLAAALVEARERGAEVSRLIAALKLPRCMALSDFDARLSRRLSHVMRPVCATGLRFGQLTFREALQQERGNWRQGEEDMMRLAFEEKEN